MYLKGSNTWPVISRASVLKKTVVSKQAIRPAEMTESEVIEKAQAGNKGCFELLYAPA
jgi:hypothetical protein